MNSPSMDMSGTELNVDKAKRKPSPVAQAENDEEIVQGNKQLDNAASSESETNQLPTKCLPLHHQDKKHRPNNGETEVDIQNNVNSFDSTESLLAIPLRYILRQTSFQNKHPHLLSRMEASLLLQSNLISYELDALLQLSIEAIEKSRACKLFSRDISESNNNVYLRPLHCLLHTHGKVIPQQVVQYVQNNLEVILGHFRTMVQSLRQCAEQNWSVSNTLLSMNTNGMEIDLLGKEKGILAEIEEEVCRRLESLMAICDEGGLVGGNVLEEESMEQFCERKFGTNASSAESNERSVVPLAMQSRTKSINDAATALGMLASGGRGTGGFDQEESI